MVRDISLGWIYSTQIWNKSNYEYGSKRVFNKCEDIIERMVYIGERDKGDPTNYHIHILAKTSQLEEVKRRITKMKNLSNPFIGEVDCNIGAANYIAKHFQTPIPLDKVKYQTAYQKKYNYENVWDILENEKLLNNDNNRTLN
jgi:hypothetical protein